MDNHRAKTIVFIFTICCSVIFFGLPTKSWGLDGADVGIYNDTLYGSGAWEEGIIANELPSGKPRSIIQLILSILPQQAAGN